MLHIDGGVVCICCRTLIHCLHFFNEHGRSTYGLLSHRPPTQPAQICEERMSRVAAGIISVGREGWRCSVLKVDGGKQSPTVSQSWDCCHANWHPFKQRLTGKDLPTPKNPKSMHSISPWLWVLVSDVPWGVFPVMAARSWLEKHCTVSWRRLEKPSLLSDRRKPTVLTRLRYRHLISLPLLIISVFP